MPKVGAAPPAKWAGRALPGYVWAEGQKWRMGTTVPLCLGSNRGGFDLSVSITWVCSWLHWITQGLLMPTCGCIWGSAPEP